MLKAATEELENVRNDFEVWITDDPIGPQGELVRSIGWQSQQDLPQVIRQCDIVVVPTIAEEALGRAAVEAMACGRPVVASRIGGLPSTVPDGGTGLLFEAGNSQDLAQKLVSLLDDASLRERLGTNGRKRFEEEYTWNRILERHYRPLLGEPIRQVAREQGAA